MKKQSAIMNWLFSHGRALVFAYNEICRSPLSSLITICVIAIAVTLPLVFFVTLKNLNLLHSHWASKAPTISLYIKPDAPQTQTQDLLRDLRHNPHIAQVTYISPEESLKSFETTTQLHDVLNVFDKNPLPGVIVVLPTLEYQKPDKINFLFQQIQGAPIIDSAQIDISWIKRLYYLIQIGNDITRGVAIFFGISVLLIISSALRTTVLNHEKEIDILKLMGATDSFIRRPLLYLGILYAVLGGFLAILLTDFFVWLLEGPVSQLAQTYNIQLTLHALSFENTINVLGLCALLALVGSWLIIYTITSRKEVS